MVKTLVTMFCVLIIIVAGALYEGDFVQRQFVEMQEVLSILGEKVEKETAVEDDVKAVQENWLEKKKYLHAFIPHNEIKEVDLWMSEIKKLVRDKKWEDVISKIDVLKDLCKQIPKVFLISPENIL